MSPPAALSLQRALQARLGTDAALALLMGGQVRLYDHAPADVPFPYLTHGRTSGFDWSTASEEGRELLVSLNVWSKARGRAETLRIMERAVELVQGRDLVLGDHVLVDLRCEAQEVRFDDDLSVYQGILRLRALIELSASE
jgi:hypothetical protein